MEAELQIKADDLQADLDRKNQEIEQLNQMMVEFETLQIREEKQSKEIMKYVDRLQVLKAENDEMKLSMQNI